MSDIDRPAAKLSIRRVISDTFGVIGRRPVLMIAPFVVLYASGPIMNLLGLQRVRATPGALALPELSPIVFAFAVIGFLLATAVYAALIYAAANDLEGRRPDLREVAERGLRRMLPVAAVSILAGLGIGFGFILVIVPGVILMLMWLLVVPVLAVEDRVGIFGSFGRSRALTRGNRWRLFGLMFLLWVLLLILEGMFGAAIGAGVIVMRDGVTFLQSAIIALISAAFAIVLCAGLAAIYVQLRELKDGGGAAAARAFE